MKKILIVDDQKTILITLKAILKQQGYRVFSATNSIDAFDTYCKKDSSYVKNRRKGLIKKFFDNFYVLLQNKYIFVVSKKNFACLAP